MEEDLSTHVYATLMLCGNCTQEVGCHALVQTRVSQRFQHIWQKFGSNSHSCNIRYVIGAYKLVIFIAIFFRADRSWCQLIEPGHKQPNQYPRISYGTVDVHWWGLLSAALVQPLRGASLVYQELGKGMKSL